MSVLDDEGSLFDDLVDYCRSDHRDVANYREVESDAGSGVDYSRLILEIAVGYGANGDCQCSEGLYLTAGSTERG